MSKRVVPIQIGCYAGFEQLAESKAAGFDYVELPAGRLGRMSDEEFQLALEIHRKVGLPTPVATTFIPGEIKVVGPAVDRPRVLAHVRRVFERAQQLGIEIVVFGSGNARRVPDDFPKEQAFQQLVEFGKLMGHEAAARGIVVAVEPLRSEETNIINTAAEGLTLVLAVEHPNFQLIVDFYHLASENEDQSILLRASDHIKHLHIANPNGRVFPRGADEYDYSQFFANVAQMNFRGRISVEAKTDDFATDGPRAVTFLRGVLNGGLALTS
jgi:D-psicose/D-tagatose/L-ribulose 3-epimerase